MFYISDIFTSKPEKTLTDLQERVYNTLEELEISYERVETDVAISMDDCKLINEKLDMDMVKTLFLCNRKKTEFYLYITAGDKKFDTKAFSKELEISRVSFVQGELFEEILKTEIGAATVFSALIDEENKIQIVFDSDVVNNEWYGCSDGVNTGYMKIRTKDILEKVMPYSKHEYKVITM